MSKLILMCGIPGSGKSTIAKTLMSVWDACGWSYKYVSRDAIRKELVGEDVDKDKYFSRETDVFNNFANEINIGLNNSKEDLVIADATHINPQSRMKILNRIKNTENVDLICLVFKTSIKECLNRNFGREGFAKVPEKVIVDMYHHFIAPAEAEFTKYKFKSIKICNI